MRHHASTSKTSTTRWAAAPLLIGLLAAAIAVHDTHPAHAAVAAQSAHAAAGATTCPTASAASYYVYVKNTGRNLVKLRPGAVDCGQWSGAANPSALRLNVKANTTAPYVTLRPRGGAGFSAEWPVTLVNGEIPDGTIQMRLEKKPLRNGASTVHLLVRRAAGDAWESNVFTKSNTKYTVVTNTCAVSACFTLRIS